VEDLKEKLGLKVHSENINEEEDAPLVKIRSVAQRLEFMIDKLGAEYCNL